MAMGLTLIFSILRVVNFAHGEFYMVGGMAVYYVSSVWLPEMPAAAAVLVACAITFVIGGAFERMFLTPMYDGRVERPIEYAVLVTFGLAFFLQYFVQAMAGASPVKPGASSISRSCASRAPRTPGSSRPARRT